MSGYLSSEDQADLMRAIVWIASAEVAYFSQRHPQAVQWTEIWTELRQSYGPMFASGRNHQTSVVLCWRNKRTRKKDERTIFVGSGECPVCTSADLLVQLRAEIPEAFEDSDETGGSNGAHPIGLFGAYVVGRA